MVKYESAAEALADGWASIDGKSDRFRVGREYNGLERLGCYMGYMIKANEMIQELERRGFVIIAKADAS